MKGNRPKAHWFRVSLLKCTPTFATHRHRWEPRGLDVSSSRAGTSAGTAKTMPLDGDGWVQDRDVIQTILIPMLKIQH